MTVTHKGVVNTGDSTLSSSRAVTAPAGLASDNIAVAYLHRWENINPTVTPPAAGTWTKKNQYLDGDGMAKIDVWWKRLTASDSGSSYSFSWTGTMYAALTVVWQGGVVTTGDPISGISAWAGTAGTFGSLTVTSTGAPYLLWYAYNDSGAAGNHTPPTHTQTSVQFTELTEPDCDTCAYRIPATTGSHTAASGSVTTSSPAAAILLALEPDTGGAPALAQSFLPFF
jgi:hypothetical protein